MVVVDCSVIVAATLRDESSEFADAIMKEMQDGSLKALVPPLFLAEAANVLVSNFRRKRIGKEELAAYVGAFSTLPLEIDSDGDMESCVRLAIEHNLSAYDAAYLELAARRRCKLATLDKSLHKAAKKEGVGYRG